MHFELRKDEDGKFFMQYWNKGREVWKSSESYERRAGALRSLNSIAKALFGNLGNYVQYVDKTNPDSPSKHSWAVR